MKKKLSIFIITFFLIFTNITFINANPLIGAAIEVSPYVYNFLVDSAIASGISFVSQKAKDAFVKASCFKVDSGVFSEVKNTNELDKFVRRNSKKTNNGNKISFATNLVALGSIILSDIFNDDSYVVSKESYNISTEGYSLGQVLLTHNFYTNPEDITFKFNNGYPVRNSSGYHVSNKIMPINVRFRYAGEDRHYDVKEYSMSWNSNYCSGGGNWCYQFNFHNEDIIFKVCNIDYTNSNNTVVSGFQCCETENFKSLSKKYLNENYLCIRMFNSDSKNFKSYGYGQIDYLLPVYSYKGKLNTSNLEANKNYDYDVNPKSDSEFIKYITPQEEEKENIKNEQPKSEINFNFDWHKLNLNNFNLKEKFPFSIPWDITNILKIFDVKPKAPIFDFPLPMGNHLKIDLTQFNDWADITRFFILIFFVIELLLITKKIL